MNNVYNTYQKYPLFGMSEVYLKKPTLVKMKTWKEKNPFLSKIKKHNENTRNSQSNKRDTIQNTQNCFLANVSQECLITIIKIEILYAYWILRHVF